MSRISIKESFSFLTEISKSRSALMGVSILWIMLFHSGIQAPDNVILRALWYLFVSFGGGFGVNLFFILSGYGLYYSVSKHSETDKIDWWLWSRKRLVRLLPSYLIVSVVYYLLKGNLSLYNILQLNFWIDGMRDFWFIPAILACYLLFPAFYICARRYGFGIVTVIFLCFLILGNILFETFSPQYEKLEIFTWRIPCFVIGVFLGYLSKFTPHLNRVLLYVIIWMAFAVCLIVTGLSRPTFLIGTVCILPILIGILFLFRLVVPILYKVIDYLGARSLQFYLLHVSIVPLALTMVWRFSYVLYFILTFIFGEILFQIVSLIKVKPKRNQS